MTELAIISPLILARARALITRHEGFRSTVYRDTRGKWTIGIGFNLDDITAEGTCRAHGLDYQALRNGSPITLEKAMDIRDDKIFAARYAATGKMPTFDDLPGNAQIVVLDMIYEMGWPVFSEFDETMASINAGKYKDAAGHMKHSAWYGEVPNRAEEDCQLMYAAAA